MQPFSLVKTDPPLVVVTNMKEFNIVFVWWFPMRHDQYHPFATRKLDQRVRKPPQIRFVTSATPIDSYVLNRGEVAARVITFVFKILNQHMVQVQNILGGPEPEGLDCEAFCTKEKFSALLE